MKQVQNNHGLAFWEEKVKGATQIPRAGAGYGDAGVGEGAFNGCFEVSTVAALRKQ